MVAVVAALSLIAGVVAAPLAPRQSDAAETARAAKIVGPDSGLNDCASCHALEVEAWQNTAHYSDFAERHRSPGAAAVLGALGLRTMKRGATCRRCHYTSTIQDGQVTPKWGVSCESCHGPAADWVGVHSHARGDVNANVLPIGAGKTEAPDARRARLAAAAAKGFIHSQMLYEIAVTCLGCHIVADEDLVNRGGHVPGSAFDLVAWSQGQVRHNYVSSPGAPSAPTNRAATPKELRRLYVTGAMVDYELSLRAFAGATAQGESFYSAMTDRFAAARKKVDVILATVPIAELTAVVATLPAIPSDGASAARAADRLRAATRAFLAKHDGADLAKLDPLIPTVYKGRPLR